MKARADAAEAEVERLTRLNNDKFRHLEAYGAASKEAERLLRLTCERICETPVAEQSSELGDISLAIDAGLERQKVRVARLEAALREIAKVPVPSIADAARGAIKAMRSKAAAALAGEGK